MSVFVHAQGIKTVHAGRGGSKNGKILSTQLLNAPLPKLRTNWGYGVHDTIIVLYNFPSGFLLVYQVQFCGCLIGYQRITIKNKIKTILHNISEQTWSFGKNLSQVPRRASQVSALKVARLGLNDGAQLWISFKLFSKQICFRNLIAIQLKVS